MVPPLWHLGGPWGDPGAPGCTRKKHVGIQVAALDVGRVKNLQFEFVSDALDRTHVFVYAGSQVLFPSDFPLESGCMGFEKQTLGKSGIAKTNCHRKLPCSMIFRWVWPNFHAIHYLRDCLSILRYFRDTLRSCQISTPSLAEGELLISSKYQIWNK